MKLLLARNGSWLFLIATLPLLITLAVMISVYHPQTVPFSLHTYWFDVATYFTPNRSFGALYISLMFLSGLFLILSGFLDYHCASRHRSYLFASCISFFSFWLLAYIPTFAAGALNPDESQQLANAIILQHRGEYFGLIDAGTHGPLVTLSLLIPNWLTDYYFAFDYGFSHMVAAALLAGNWAIFIAVARKTPARPFALLIALPLLFITAFLPLHNNIDFPAFNAHHVAMILCSCGLGSGILAHFVRRNWTANLLAIISGAAFVSLLFAKMQWAPLGFLYALCIMLSYMLFAPQRVRIQRLVYFITGGAIPAIVILGTAALQGYLSDFLTRYLFGQLSYAKDNAGWPDLAVWLWAWFSPAMSTYGVLHIILIGGIFSALKLNRAIAEGACDILQTKLVRFIMIASLLIFLCALLSIVLPGNLYSHYCYLIIHAASVIGYVLMCTYFVLIPPENIKWFARSIPLILTIFLTYLCTHSLEKLGRHLGIIYYTEPWKKVSLKQDPACLPSSRDKLVAMIKRASAPDESMTVWAWDFDLFVQANRVNANKATLVQFMTERFGDMQQSAAKAFMNEIQTQRPRIFVDAVVPAALDFNDKSRFGLQRIPALKPYLVAHYNAPITIDCYQMWVRKD